MRSIARRCGVRSVFARCLHRDPRGESRRRVERLLFVRESSLAKKFSEHGGVSSSLGDGESRRAKLGHLAPRRRGWTAVGGVSGDAQDALGARDAHCPLPFEIFPRVLRFVVVVVASSAASPPSSRANATSHAFFTAHAVATARAAYPIARAARRPRRVPERGLDRAHLSARSPVRPRSSGLGVRSRRAVSTRQICYPNTCQGTRSRGS